MTKQIIFGDCFDVMPTLEDGSVDLVLADPPYAISRETGFQSVRTGEKRFAISMDFGGWDQEEIDLPRFAAESFRLLRKGGTIICFYDIWKISKLALALQGAGFKQLRFLEWVKTNPVPINSKRNYLTNAREIALSAVRHSKPTFNGEYDNGIYRHPIARAEAGRERHPTEKPLELFRELILKHSNPGDLVLDPFLGSGTTVLAAEQEGRRSIGIEFDEGYVEMSQKRCGDE